MRTLPFFRLRSLKARILIAALLIILLGMWSLSYFASRMLRDDMEHVLGDQQLCLAMLEVPALQFIQGD